MEMFNFSAGETSRINRALGFIGRQEVDLDRLTARTLVVKTENFDDECEQLAPYFAGLGLENSNARLVFNTAKDGGHKILINKAAITGLSYVHALVTELVHLANLSRYSAEHGNVYRLEPEQAIADHYYEFLLWTKFQAMRIATRAHALVSWHEVNGEAPPQGNRYQFAEVTFPGEGIKAALQRVEQAGTIAVWREGLWDLLEEMAFYLGRLAFYQQEARPGDLDACFPAVPIEETVGLVNCLSFYAALQAARNYPGWLAEKHTIRKAIVGMQEQGRQRYEPGA
jgi:hypothetical protein